MLQIKGWVSKSIHDRILNLDLQWFRIDSQIDWAHFQLLLNFCVWFCFFLSAAAEITRVISDKSEIKLQAFSFWAAYNMKQNNILFVFSFRSTACVKQLFISTCPLSAPHSQQSWSPHVCFAWSMPTLTSCNSLLSVHMITVKSTHWR